MSDSIKPTDNSIPGNGWTNGSIPLQFFLAPQTVEGKVQLYQHHRRWIGLHSSWTRIGQGDTELSKRTSASSSGESIIQDEEEEAKRVRSLISQLCESFYRAGWATGTGGGISIRTGGPQNGRPWRVFVAPSGIQKEDMIGEDIFELDMDRNVIYPPKTPGLRQSACTPLWYVVYRLRPTATAVIHTHSMNAVMATLLDPTETSTCLRLTHLEMLKGVGNHSYDDMLEIPIIDNRPTEDQLADQLEEAMQRYPRSNAILVRRHGIYAWGDSWEQAKTICESFDYLLECAIKMRSMGLDPSKVPVAGTYRLHDEETEPPLKKQNVRQDGFRGDASVDNTSDCALNTIPLLPRDNRILLLDIEGCTTSISFVKDQLFPYARLHLTQFLRNVGKDKYHDFAQGLAGEIPSDAAVDRQSVEAMVTWLMDRDIKSSTLKEIQGQMWKVGYEAGELRGHVYDDFIPMLEWMKKHNVRLYIYSSGSVQAQKLLFGNSLSGNLLHYINGHFDIPAVGNKTVASSYATIAQTLQVTNPGEIVFCSDSEAELAAAKETGLQTVMTIRPGNTPLTSAGRSIPAVHSLLQLCGS